MQTLASSEPDPRYDALQQGRPILIVPRALHGGVARALDALPKEALPRLRYVGAPTALRPTLRRSVAERIGEPRWLVRWFVEDVLDKAALLANLTGAPGIDLRLDVVEDDRCRLFHLDNVRLRLMTTYRGPGTEWISPRIAATLTPGAVPPPDSIRHLDRGEVAVMRGSRGGDVRAARRAAPLPVDSRHGGDPAAADDRRNGTARALKRNIRAGRATKIARPIARASAGPTTLNPLNW